MEGESDPDLQTTIDELAALHLLHVSGGYLFLTDAGRLMADLAIFCPDEVAEGEGVQP